jgi:predicted nucleic acid-binding protein
MLVDTNVISELIRRQPNAGVMAWADALADFSISAVTVDEITYGLSWRPNARVEAWFDSFLRRHPVFPITEAIARRAGELRGAFAARGVVRSQADMMIAATAQVHTLTLVTRNEDDFRGCGIPVLNPFSP